MEPIRAVSPTVSGAYKSGESYRKWKRLLKAAVNSAAFFRWCRFETKKIIILSN